MGTNDLSELWFPADAIHGDRLVLPNGTCARSLTLPQVLVLLWLMAGDLTGWIRNLVPDVSSLELNTVRWLEDCYLNVGYGNIRIGASHDVHVLREFLYGSGTKLLPCVDGTDTVRIRTGAYDAWELEEILGSFHTTDAWSGWMEKRPFLWVLAPVLAPLCPRFLWLKDGISESLVRNTMTHLERK